MKQKTFPGNQKAYSADEIEKIVDLTKVLVIWRGGNGPHEYVAKWSGDHLMVYVSSDMRRPIDSVYSKGNKFVLDQITELSTEGAGN